MIIFKYPDGAEQFDSAAFTQDGAWLMSGHREECELAALECCGLYCLWVDGRPVIRKDFE